MMDQGGWVLAMIVLASVVAWSLILVEWLRLMQ